jgi:hypothetical protein
VCSHRKISFIICFRKMIGIASYYFKNPLETTVLTIFLSFVLAYIIGDKKSRERVQIKNEIKRLRNERERRRREFSKKKPSGEDGEAIVRMTVAELMNAMRTKKYTCEEVVRAFCFRAMHAGKNANATTEELFESAIKRARAIDHIRRNKSHDVKKEPPLLGLPISVKDQYDMEGCYSDMGLGTRLLKGPSSSDGLLCKILKNAGAIFFTRTNVPQALLVAESNNSIWGEAKNPHDLNRTPGGSSGGEGALIASLGSPVGLGTDIGGSIRIPAHNNGVYGFKPTGGRITSKGLSVPRVCFSTNCENLFISLSLSLPPL